MRTAAQIQEELDLVSAAIPAVLSGQEYTLDTGQSKQIVKRANLSELIKYKESLESELSVVKKKESCTQRGKGVFDNRGYY